MGYKDSLAATAQGRDRLIGPLLLISLILLAVGLLAPALSVGSFLFRRDYSLLQAVWTFWRAEKYFLFLVVGGFSVVLPALKTVLAAAAWYAVPLGHGAAERLIRLLAAISKWSMLDVFIIALTVLALEGSLFRRADIHPGLIAFAAAVLLSTLAIKRMEKLTAPPT